MPASFFSSPSNKCVHNEKETEPMKHILTSIMIAGAIGITVVPTTSAQEHGARELPPTITGTGTYLPQERVQSQPTSTETANVRTYPNQAVQCATCRSHNISIPNFSDIRINPPQTPPTTPPGTPIPYPTSRRPAAIHEPRRHPGQSSGENTFGTSKFPAARQQAEER